MKGKQDEAAMTAADREALEIAEIRAQFAPLFDLYSECINLVEECGVECVPDNLHDSLVLVAAVRTNLGLAQTQRDQGTYRASPCKWGLMVNLRLPRKPRPRSTVSWATVSPAWVGQTWRPPAPWSRPRGTSSSSSGRTGRPKKTLSRYRK
jgi:hypothetical protein